MPSSEHIRCFQCDLHSPARFLWFFQVLKFVPACRLVKQVFAQPSELSSASCEEDSVWSDKLLDFHCPLFARKFPNVTAMAIRDMMADCRNRLDIVACSDQNQQKGRRGPQNGLLSLG